MGHFKNYTPGLESPASHLFEIIPSDTTALSLVTRAITVETSGHLQVITTGGDSGRIFVAAVVPFPLRVSHVMASGTTATGIVGLA